MARDGPEPARDDGRSWCMEYFRDENFTAGSGMQELRGRVTTTSERHHAREIRWAATAASGVDERAVWRVWATWETRGTDTRVDSD